MFIFTPSSIVSSRLIGQPANSKVQADTSQDSSASKYSGGCGIIVSGRQVDDAGVKTCSSRKQNNMDNDVFLARPPDDFDGYDCSARSRTESQCNDEFNSSLRRRKIDRNVTRRTSGLPPIGDMKWAGQSQATPLRSSGTFSFSESARLCQSCGTRFTNSVSLYGSQESLSFDEYQVSADVYSTICSVFWKMSLTFHPFVSNASNQSLDYVKFSSLWPNSYGLTCLLPEICASLQGSIEALCRIAIFADVVKLLSTLIDLKIVSKFFHFLCCCCNYRYF